MIPTFAQIPVTGLMAYYPFNGNANDMSGNGYNGTVSGATLAPDRFGNANSAYAFDGANDYIDLSSYVSSFNFSQPATVSFWVNTKYDTPQTIYSTSNGTNGLYEENIYIGNGCTGTLTNEVITISSQRVVPNNYIIGFTTTQRDTLINSGWHHIAVVYDNISTKIYLDTVLVNISCSAGTNNGHFGNLPVAAKTTLGTRWNNGYGGYFHGTLDDLRIYNSVLNTTEITALFEETFTAVENLTNVGSEFQMYPNPSCDFVNIRFLEYSASSRYFIKIINSLGQIVYQKRAQLEQSIPVTILGGSGFYIVELTDNYHKVIKARRLITN